MAAETAIVQRQVRLGINDIFDLLTISVNHGPAPVPGGNQASYGTSSPKSLHSIHRKQGVA